MSVKTGQLINKENLNSAFISKIEDNSIISSIDTQGSIKAVGLTSTSTLSSVSLAVSGSATIGGTLTVTGKINTATISGGTISGGTMTGGTWDATKSGYLNQSVITTSSPTFNSPFFKGSGANRLTIERTGTADNSVIEAKHTGGSVYFGHGATGYFSIGNSLDISAAKFKVQVSTGNTEATGTITGTRFISNIATGTSPLAVTSTTKVTNLNVDRLDDYHAGNATGQIPISNGTVNTNLNADMLDGLHVSAIANTDANAIVRTNASGYIQAGWINTTSGSASGTITRVYASQDSYLRYLTPANFISSLDLMTKAGGIFTGPITVATNSSGGYPSLTLNNTSGHKWKIWAIDGYDLRISDETSGGDLVTIKGTSGNVGIGTTSPTSNLHISADGYNQITIQRTNASYVCTYAIGTPNGNLTFGRNTLASSERDMVINNSGNVGIGNVSPTAKLDVTGTIKASSTINGATISGGTLSGGTWNSTKSGYLNQAVLTTSSPKFSKLTLSAAIGTAPMTITSTTAVTNLNADLLDGHHGSYYAPLASPTFTGTPKAPTAAAGTNTTQLATTAFVNSHAASSGTSHTYINQDVRTTASPTFANITSSNTIKIKTWTIQEDTASGSLKFIYG